MMELIWFRIYRFGAPYWKSEAKAIIAGMSRSTGKAELVKAANESIAYQINDVILAMRKIRVGNFGIVC